MSLALLALLTCAIEPSAGACPEDRSGVERALRLQVEADGELAAGRHAPAAVRLGEVADAYPECTTYHKRRMNAVLRAVEAWRAAFEASRDRSHLDTALTLTDGYLESLEAVYGAEAATRDGHVRLQQARAELAALLPVVEAEPPPAARPPADPLDRPPVRRSAVAPIQARDAGLDPRRRKLLIAGSVMLGAGAGTLIMLIAGAVRGHTLERDEEGAMSDCTSPAQGVCGDIDERRAAVDGVVIAGIAVTPALVGAGVALMAVAHRRRPRSAISLVPTIHPRRLGLGLEARF